MNPYRIEGPALISFSGGRTSGFMLWHILDAYDGKLPDDVHVCFANTGKEREETLRFVHECGSRWGVQVRWLEYAGTGTPNKSHGAVPFCQVAFATASRNSEPFDRLLEGKTSLPNWQARWCTTYLKVLPMFSFMASMGFAEGSYLECTGLRADEAWRVLKMHGRNSENGGRCCAPLDQAGVTKRDVMAFWAAQPFDLGLTPGEGNCDLCFMKGAKLRASLIRDNPALAMWWAAKEVDGRFFDRRTRYATLASDVQRSPDLFLNDSDPDDEHDAECGLWCAGEAA